GSLADRLVFIHDAVVLNRHFPSAEINQPSAKLLMRLEQSSTFQHMSKIVRNRQMVNERELEEEQHEGADRFFGFKENLPGDFRSDGLARPETNLVRWSDL